MPIVQQFHAAAEAARNFSALDEISRTLWQAHAAGALSDDAAQAAAEAVEARKATLRGPRPSPASKRISARRRPCRSPDRAASIARRRRVAMSGAIPAKLAANFTQGEVAALSIIAGEIRRNGDCRLCIDAIAAKAGTSRSVVQRALKQARALGLVHVEERPQPGRKNLTNVVTVTSPDWRAWLRLGGDSVSKKKHNEYQNIKYSEKASARDDTGLRSLSVLGIFGNAGKETPPCRTNPKF